jgi:hypothetical protein
MNLLTVFIAIQFVIDMSTKLSLYFLLHLLTKYVLSLSFSPQGVAESICIIICSFNILCQEINYLFICLESILITSRSIKDEILSCYKLVFFQFNV